MITIHIRFFAGHRDIVGAASQTMQIHPGTSLAQVWQQLVATYPPLDLYTDHVLYARNQEFAEPDTIPLDGDEVAFIPPVSGGKPDVLEPFLITPDPLDPLPLVAYVQTPEDGAVVTFAGVVRNQTEGRATAYLSYEAYSEMATPLFARIANEARERWAIGRVAIHHRIGRVEIGQTAVLIVVAAPHRETAFAATAYLMDRIKAIVPIWKEEHWADSA